MSKVMTLPDLKLNISRNGFDLSKKKLFSAKVGELTPVAVIPTLPKDKFRFNLSHFTRTEPLGAPAYTRINEYIDAFFVPYQLMWKAAGYYLNDLGDQQQSASSMTKPASPFAKMPWFPLSDVINYLNELSKQGSETTTKNQFGFDRATLSHRLLSYLGYPTAPWAGHDWNSIPAFDQELSPFPLCAYQKVYQDHFRFDVWEKTSPWTWNLDWVTPQTLKLKFNDLGYAQNTMLDMRYVNNERDLFFGVYPDSQLGDEALVAVGAGGDPTSFVGAEPFLYASESIVDGNAKIKYLGGHFNLFSADDKRMKFKLSDADVAALRQSLGINAEQGSSFSVLQLRVAEYLQRYREVIQTGGQDIKSRLKHVWDADVPAYYSDLSYRLGGYKSEIAINPTTNTNLAAADSEATIQATATSTDNKGFVNFDAGDYGNLPGLIIITYYARPLLEYSQNRAQLATTLITKEDFANPAFDRIGMQQLHLLDMINYPAIFEKVKDVPLSDLFIGYAPRYIKWKTDVDEIVGKFRTPSYSPWSCSIDDDYINKWLKVEGSPGNRRLIYDYNIFKVNPSYVNSLFKAQADATYDTDVFLINFAYDCQAVRQLDYNGMPY